MKILRDKRSNIFICRYTMSTKNNVAIVRRLIFFFTIS